MDKELSNPYKLPPNPLLSSKFPIPSTTLSHSSSTTTKGKPRDSGIGLPGNTRGGMTVWDVLWREPQARKNKSWESDGILVVQPSGQATLRHTETGKTICSGQTVPGSLVEDAEIKFGGKDVMIQDPMTLKDYNSRFKIDTITILSSSDGLPIPLPPRIVGLSKKFAPLVVRRVEVKGEKKKVVEKIRSASGSGSGGKDKIGSAVTGKAKQKKPSSSSDSEEDVKENKKKSKGKEREEVKDSEVGEEGVSDTDEGDSSGGMEVDSDSDIVVEKRNGGINEMKKVGMEVDSDSELSFVNPIDKGKRRQSPSPSPPSSSPKLPSPSHTQTQLPPSSSPSSSLDPLFRPLPPPLPTWNLSFPSQHDDKIFTQLDPVLPIQVAKKKKPWDELEAGGGGGGGKKRKVESSPVRVQEGRKRGGNHYYTCQWRKPNQKKHKVWEADAVLVVIDKKAVLRDRDSGAEIARGPTSGQHFLPGDPVYIGSKEIEIECILDESSYLSGSVFLKGAPTSSLLPPPAKFLKPFAPPTAFRKPSLPPPKENFAIPALGVPKPAISPPVNFYAAPAKKVGPKFDPEAKGAVVMKRPHGWQNKRNATIVDVVVDPILSEKMRDHQIEGVKFMYECVMGIRHEGSGCILADDMGLGKSIQAIALLFTLLKQNPFGGVGGVVDRVLIACPATLVQNWSREIKKWLGRDRVGVFVADGKNNIKTFAVSKSYQVLIIGYEKLRSVIDDVKYAQPPIGLIICDEGHKLKGTGTQIAKALRTLSAPKRVILSGTPVQNNLSELHAMVDFVNPGMLGDYPQFKKIYEGPIIKSRDHHSKPKDKELGEARASKLNEDLKQYLLRREADAIKKYLPPKFEYTVFIVPTALEIKLHQAILDGKAVREVLSGAGSQQLSLLMALRKLSTTPGLLMQQAEAGTGMDILTEAVTSQFPLPNTDPNAFFLSGKLTVLGTFLKTMAEINKAETEEKNREKIVVLSNFTQTLDVIEKHCIARKYPYCRLDGKTPQGDRVAMVDAFNRGFTKTHFVFLLSSKSGGTGLNITGASRLIALDGDWNPSNDAQAMARIHRQGQTKTCYIYRFLTTGTMDEKIFQRQVTKLALSNTFLTSKGGSEKADSGAAAGAGGGGGNAFTLDDLRNIFKLHIDTASQTHDLLGCVCHLPKEDVKPIIDSKMLVLGSSDDEDEKDQVEDEFDLPNVSQINTFMKASQWTKQKVRKYPTAPPKSSKNLSVLNEYTHFNGRDFASVEAIEDGILKAVIYTRIATPLAGEIGNEASGSQHKLVGGNVSFAFLTLGKDDDEA